MARRFPTVFLLPLLLMGCNRYQITFNEQPIHTPPKLFTDYQIPDPALRNCVAQTVHDQGIAAAQDLRRLVCSNAGIASLDGIAIFSGLETLNLSSNALGSIAPLLAMPSLTQVDLRGNPGLDCRQATTLTASGVAATIPPHCATAP